MMLITLSLLLPAALCAVFAASGFTPQKVGGRIRNLLCMVSPAAVLPAVALALTGPGETLELPWLLLGSRLEVDAVARPLLLAAAVLYGAAPHCRRRRDRTARGWGRSARCLLVSALPCRVRRSSA